MSDERLEKQGRPDICGLCKQEGRACDFHLRSYVYSLERELEETKAELVAQYTDLAIELNRKEARLSAAREVVEAVRDVECGPDDGCAFDGQLHRTHACSRHAAISHFDEATGEKT